MKNSIQQVEGKSLNHILNYTPFILLVLGVVLFYSIKINIWLKWLIMLVFLSSAISVFFFLSPLGLGLHSYLRDSYIELGKVVWPTRKEATQFTWIIFIFIVVLGLFLWLVDSGISWLFYNVILGRV